MDLNIKYHIFSKTKPIKPYGKTWQVHLLCFFKLPGIKPTLEILEREKNNRGKRLFGLLFGLVIVIQLIIVITYLIKIGPDKISGQVIRIIITALLFGLTYYGNRISKWILVGYFIFNSIQGFSKIKSIEDYYMIGIIGFYLIASIMILFNPPINRFLEGQKMKNVR